MELNSFLNGKTRIFEYVKISKNIFCPVCGNGYVYDIKVVCEKDTIKAFQGKPKIRRFLMCWCDLLVSFHDDEAKERIIKTLFNYKYNNSINKKYEELLIIDQNKQTQAI